MLKGNKVCLGKKKRGHGVGKYNGYGGKMEEGETFAQTASRELFEECGVRVAQKDLTKVAEIEFIEEKGDWLVHVFTTNKFVGEPQPSDEMDPMWFDKARVPYDQMWVDDRLWVKKVFAGEKFKATFWFDNEGKIIKHSFLE